ncbi:MAG TPA: hypothetical protein VF740_15070, partial [Candidatus Acidoferrum sp.]
MFPARGRTPDGHHYQLGVSQAAAPSKMFNQCIFFGLLIAVIISGLQVLRGVHRLVRGTPDRAPSQAKQGHTPLT